MTTSADIRMQWDIRIPMRDGVELSAILYLPRVQQSPAPAIFTLTPYIAQTHHDQGTYFARHGYAYLSVDVRGRGNSGGSFHPINEAKDGHDIVEWLAQQPYCSGQVAMWGGSYMGYVQWAAAKELPPHLATIVPVASPFRGVDAPMRNNMLAPNRVQWLALLAGHALQDRMFADRQFWSAQFRLWFEAGAPFKQLDAFLGVRSDVFQEWLQHPQRDAYWDSFNPTPQQYASIEMPILTITGSYDSNQPGALEHYREHMRHALPQRREHHYLIIGPWDHAGTRIPKLQFAGLNVGPASLLDLPKLHLDWYRWVMQEGPKPEFLRKRVAYYVMGADTWRYADSLEQVTARAAPLYLHSTTNPTDVFRSGSLVDEPPARGEPDWYVYDPADVSHAALESALDPDDRTDQRLLLAQHGKHLIYHGEPFEQDTEVSGFFRLSVWLSIDQPDTDFRASVHEILVDGSSVQLATDCLRARHRKGLREAELIRTTQPIRYDFERFTFISRRVARGSRLRLVIGPISSIYSQKNYNSGKPVADESRSDARIVTARLFHDGEHPSALYVPLAQPEI